MRTLSVFVPFVVLAIGCEPAAPPVPVERPPVWVAVHVPPPPEPEPPPALPPPLTQEDGEWLRDRELCAARAPWLNARLDELRAEQDRTCPETYGVRTVTEATTLRQLDGRAEVEIRPGVQQLRPIRIGCSDDLRRRLFLVEGQARQCHDLARERTAPRGYRALLWSTDVTPPPDAAEPAPAQAP